MQLGDPAVVAPEERQEVQGQVILVDIRQRADDAEVERDVTVEIGAVGPPGCFGAAAEKLWRPFA
jgi:hypothetical protein